MVHRDLVRIENVWNIVLLQTNVLYALDIR